MTGREAMRPLGAMLCVAPFAVCSVLLASCASAPDADIAAEASRWAPDARVTMVHRAQVGGDVGGDAISYFEAGHGPPVVMIHGAMASGECWLHQIARLAEHYHLIVPDLRGHGGSAAGSKPHTVELYAADVVALMDQLHVERAVVCGHSLGGMVAQSLAIAFPERVRALVLAETSYGIRARVGDRIGSSLARWYVRASSPATVIRATANGWGRQNARTRAYLYHAMSRYLTEKDTMIEIWRAVDGFESKQRLREISQPTLIVSAAGNRQTLRQAREMEELIPHASRVVVPEAGHLVMLDNPEAFSDPLQRFLASL